LFGADNWVRFGWFDSTKSALLHETYPFEPHYREPQPGAMRITAFRPTDDNCPAKNIKVIVNAKEPSLGVHFSEFYPDISALVTTFPGDEQRPLEDRIRLLYTLNSFLARGMRTDNQRFYSYVHGALDNPYDITDYYTAQYKYHLQRSRSLFDRPQEFSPEALAELRRVADRTLQYQRIGFWNFFFESMGLSQFFDEFSFIDELGDSLRVKAKYLKMLHGNPAGFLLKEHGMNPSLTYH
jgi:hypothetical protein